MVHWFSRTTIVVTAVACAVSILLAEPPGTRRDAESFKQKADAITTFGESASKQSRRTTVTERELNAYLTFEAQAELPPGVLDPSVTILGTGRIAGRAVVDLDAIRMNDKTPKSALDPMAYLTGKLPVTATGVLQAANGVGRLQLDSATVAGIPVPKMLLQEIVSYYSRTPDKPGGVSLDEAFPLPSRIREIQVQRGQAIIIQ